MDKSEEEEEALHSAEHLECRAVLIVNANAYTHFILYNRRVYIYIVCIYCIMTVMKIKIIINKISSAIHMRKNVCDRVAVCSLHTYEYV